MTFYVQKRLATGPIRFGVSPRKTTNAIDDDAGLSTGPSGEFVRHRDLFFSADTIRRGAPTLPTAKSISSTPFLSSLKPDGTPRGWGFLALMIFGAIFVLLGIAVLATKGPAGWVEIILGIIAIAVPIVMTAQRRKQIREQEERDRAAREAEEKRNRELLRAYATALEAMRAKPDAQTIAALRRERDALTLPYELWSPSAREAVLAIGFDALARLEPERAHDVASLMHETASAAGLNTADARETVEDLYRAVLWHLLADDRLGPAQEAQLTTLRDGLGVGSVVDDGSAQEFRNLSGITRDTLPKRQCGAKLAFQEYCIHETRGSLMRFEKSKKKPARWVLEQECTVYITNKRIIVDAKKGFDVLLPKVDDVTVNVDDNILTIETDDPKKPVHLQLPDPIYTANLIDMATALDQRPKGFA